MARVLVCLGGSCTSVGSAALVRDLEELAAGSVDVEEWGCLGKCGKGPNVEIESGGSKRIIKGVKSFKKAVSVVADEADGDVTPMAQKVGKIKYECRREADVEKKKALIQQGFSTIGGEGSSEKRICAELLVLRSQLYLKEFAGSALKDAQAATQLAGGWAQPWLALGAAYEACSNAEEGVKAIKEALQIGKGINKPGTNRLMKRLERKAADEAEDPEGTAERRAQKTAQLASQSAPKAKAKVKASAKVKNKSKAAKKEPPEAVAVATEPVAEPEEAKEEEEGGFWHRWQLEGVERLNHDCLEFTLKAANAKATAAQIFPNDDVWHIDVKKELDGEEAVVRAYTPISTCAEYKQGFVRLMVKVYSDGKMTQWMAKWQVGQEIPMSVPLGTVDPTMFFDGLFMIAGGSAATVAIQLCLAVLKNFPAGPVVRLVLCNRTIEDVLYTSIFDNMLSEHATFQLTHCVSSGKLPDPRPGRAVWKPGRVSNEVLDDLPAEMAAVVSGPPGLCRSALDLWLSLGRDQDNMSILDEVGAPPPQVEKPPAVEMKEPEPKPSVSVTAEEVEVVEEFRPKKAPSKPPMCGIFAAFCMAPQVEADVRG